MASTTYYDLISPTTQVLWDREMRQRAVDMLSKQSLFLPSMPLLDRDLAKRLVAEMSMADLSEAMFGSVSEVGD